MLLFLVKYSRSDIANSARELLKVNDGATENHVKILLRVIRYVITSKNKGLYYKIPKEKGNKWVFWGYRDSDWAGDRNNCRSITVYCVYFMGYLIVWKSIAQKNVMLLSSEAEYIAISEICSEIEFVKMILEFLEINVEKPITTYCNNIRAIFMRDNAKSGARTKHIDMRYHHVQEYVVDGLVDIVFV